MEPGSRLGPYEILEKLGAGGMGEVFRAKDTRLDRDVAIKVMPGEFAASAESRARFGREARLLSKLSHPNICVVYDVGETAPVASGGDAVPGRYIVMEYLEGESLAQRLARGPLPLDQVYRYGAQIADALEKAHRSGIVHRDLKPGNVLLTRSGAKLLDFGLAKAMEREGDAECSRATEELEITREGRVIGTLRYMAPEQLGGLDADTRTDIFAFGVLLYEMATGKPAFDASSRISLIAAIASGEPRPMREIQPLTPPALEHIVQRCMEKLPDDRWQSMHDLRVELEWISPVGSGSGPSFRLARKGWLRNALFAVALVGAFAVAGAYLSAKKSAVADPPLIVEIVPQSGERFVVAGNAGGPAVIAPDGKWIAYVARKDDTALLWVRSIESGESKPVPGTAGAYFPFWAPDSRRIGYFGSGGLRRVDIGGGDNVLLAAARNGRGGAWNSDGTIIFAPDVQTPLHLVSDRGGPAKPLAGLERPYSTYRWPAFLPDGVHYLFFAGNHREPSGEGRAIFIASLRDRQPRLLVRNASNGVFADGKLLFVRDGILWARTMSPDGRFSGAPAIVARNVTYDEDVWRAGVSVSNDSRLLYLQGEARLVSTLEWCRRDGTSESRAGVEDKYWEIALAPDGTRAVLSIGDPLRQLWITDLPRDSRTRLTLDYAWTAGPIWSRDGSHLYFTALEGTTSIVLRRAIETGKQDELARFEGLVWPAAEGADGRSLLLCNDTKGDIIRLALDGRGRAEPYLADPAARETQLVGSPDGRWFAYSSNETGTFEVYIARTSAPSIKYQASRGGGMQPNWRLDGGEFYFVDPRGMLIAVPLGTAGDELSLGDPRPLFRVPTGLGMSASRVYAPSGDGTRFLVIRPMEPDPPVVRLVSQWQRIVGRETAGGS